MSPRQKELQVIEISSGSVRARSSVPKSGKRRKKKRNSLCSLLRALFLSAAMILLVYVSAAGVLLYDRMHPPKELCLEERMQKPAERNPETADFVKNYENREAYIGKEIDLSEEIKEGEVPLLMQWDKRCGYESLGDSNIGLSGCGPTCFSMAYLYFTGDVQGDPGYYILLRGYDENGFFVNEPNRKSNSEKQWTYETLKGQIRNLWALGSKEE